MTALAFRDVAGQEVRPGDFVAFHPIGEHAIRFAKVLNLGPASGYGASLVIQSVSGERVRRRSRLKDPGRVVRLLPRQVPTRVRELLGSPPDPVTLEVLEAEQQLLTARLVAIDGEMERVRRPR